MIQWKTIPFDSAFKDVTSKGNKIPQDTFHRVGKYPIVDQGESFIAGYLDDESLAWKEQLPVIIFGDHTRILKFVNFRFILGADGTKVLQPSKELFPKFAYYNLLFLDIPSAGYSRHFRFLKESEIPLPNYDEQKRIAAILDKADRLRRQRRFAQTLSDSFLQSVFIKMFGEQLKEDFSTTDLIDLVIITGGGTPSREVEDYFKGKFAWLTSKDMRGDYIFDTEEHITEQAIKDSATKLVPKGSILMVVKSKVLMNRLPLAIAEIPMCHGQDIKSIQCSKKVNSLFLLYVLKYNEWKLLSLARGANTEGLTLPMFESVPVPNAPLPLQEKFAEIVQKFERVRRQQREATRQAEHLFQTLLHRAFRGEL